jgi:hypothetical protein
MCSTGCPDYDENIGLTEDQIINGAVPSPGGLASYGVVSLGGCTGTLLDNRHVLTAHHCVRDPSNGWAGPLAIGIIATYEDGGPWQTAGVAKIFEPEQTWTLDGHDYALLTLSVPIKVAGSASGFSNPIYASGDSTLASRDVFCAGYGGTVAATATTYAIGFGTLSSATMRISGTSDGVLTRNSMNGQVGFGGDSGSTCFLNGNVLGVQSTCSGYSVFDVNGNGSAGENWTERGAPSSCNSAAPSQFRIWAGQKQTEAVDTNFVFVATLASAVD